MFFEKLIGRVKEVLSTKRRKEVLRRNMLRNFSIKDKNSPVESDFINSKLQSMKDSQGTSDFSGSGYNGPGNVDHGKTIRYKPRHDFQRST